MTSQAVCEWLREFGYESKPIKVTLPKKILVKNGQEKREGTIELEGAWYLDRVEPGRQTLYVLGELDYKAINKMNCFRNDTEKEGGFYVACFSNKRTFQPETFFYETRTEADMRKIHPFGHSIVMAHSQESFFEYEEGIGELKGEYQMKIEYLPE